MTLESSMKKTISALTLVAALAAGGGAAQAADLQYRKAPLYEAAPAYSWTGFYVGANTGGGFSAANAFNSYLGPNTSKASGFVGGAQVGYNYQLSPRFVVGIENDFIGLGISTRNNGLNTPDVKVPFYGTGRARAGFTLLDSRLLVYATGGLAFGQVNDTGLNKMRIGGTGGGGVEWAFLPHLSAKLEYLYTDLNKDFKKEGLPDRTEKFQTISVGLNYHF